MNRSIETSSADTLATIMAALRECYGSLNKPDYYRVSEILRAKPYAAVMESLRERGITITDTTDLNYDVSLRLGLDRAGEQVSLALSALGPFAGIVHQDQKDRYCWVTQPDDAPTPLAATTAQTVQQAGFTLLDRDLVARLIPMNWYDGSTQVTLYQALFSDSDHIP